MDKPSLAETHPELAAQADGWDPTTVTKGSNKKVNWSCPQGHTWNATIKNRSNVDACAVCSGQKVLVGFNDLVTINPELAAQANGWDPTTLTGFSNKIVGWCCQYGHTWAAKLAHRSNGSGCPICENKKVLTGFNDLATTNPELAAQANGWDPKLVVAGSGRKVAWRCELGHSWKASVDSRSSGSGCPICSGRNAWTGVNDLATTNPELAAQANGWDPTTLSKYSNKIVSWRCQYGHTWRAAVNNRSQGSGCAVCSGHKVLVGFNDLATINPALAAQADGWDPTTLTAHAGKKVGWRCELGHTWSALVSNRSVGRDCAVCSGHKVLVGFNDLATTNLELAAQANGWDPTTLTAGSAKKVAWKCEQGHTWRASIGNRSFGRGCPTCAQNGFDPNKPGWLYLIENDVLDMLQIGISNFPETRLGQHSKGGWVAIQVRGPMKGHLAQHLETAILHAVERRGAVLGHKADIEKFDGYSEAWTKESLKVTSIKQLLDWVYEDDHTL